MIIKRLGNKRVMAKNIVKFFPPHEIYIEPFFGAGGIFFNKELCTHNIINDNCKEIFNLWSVIKDPIKNSMLEKEWIEIPLSIDVFEYLKKMQFDDDIKMALRTLYLANTSFFGTGNTFVFSLNFPKKTTLKLWDLVSNKIQNTKILNCDFRDVFNYVSFRYKKEKDKSFIYCDPPYLGTGNNYSSNWTQSDFDDLIKMCLSSNIKFAISEFENEYILETCRNLGLNIITINAQKRNLKNTTRKEILITNYKVEDKDKLLFNGE